LGVPALDADPRTGASRAGLCEFWILDFGFWIEEERGLSIRKEIT
jgi:hypothetical protein